MTEKYQLPNTSNLTEEQKQVITEATIFMGRYSYENTDYIEQKLRYQLEDILPDVKVNIRGVSCKTLEEEKVTKVEFYNHCGRKITTLS